MCLSDGTSVSWFLNKYLVKKKKADKDKAVLEPQISPAFAITYFCNNRRIDPVRVKVIRANLPKDHYVP